MVNKVATLRSQIEKLQAELLEEEERMSLISEGDPKELAILLHKLKCNSNHTDQCGWHYEIGKNGQRDWNGYAHAEYLKKANAFLQHFGEDDISEKIAIYEFIKKL